eukprot:5201931-Pleurochrysis_carterae.AAC.1
MSAVHGSPDLDMAGALDVPCSGEGRRSDKKGEAPADSSPPEKYLEVTLAVEENGKALLILSSATKKGRAERES